jgi:hypothetical protein
MVTSTLPSLQKPTKGPNTKPDKSSSQAPNLFKIHFNITLPSMPSSLEQSLQFRLPD